jgi:hypothetical protein
MENNDTQKTEVTAALEPQTSAVLAQVAAETQAFELVQRQAMMLSKSTLVPKDFAGNVANCAIALNVAKRTRLDPLMVCQNLAIIHGRPSWSATALIGMINASGKFSPLRFVFDSDEAPTWCYAVARDMATSEELKGERITLEMAKKEGWSTKNGSKWLTMPGQMLRYRAASFWSRAYASDMSLGMYTQDEVRDFAEPPRNVTPKVNPFVAEPEPEPEPEPVEVVEAQVVVEEKADGNTKPYDEKIAEAFDKMTKEEQIFHQLHARRTCIKLSEKTEEKPKKDSAKPHADKIAEAFEAMAKEVEP